MSSTDKIKLEIFDPIRGYLQAYDVDTKYYETLDENKKKELENAIACFGVTLRMIDPSLICNSIITDIGNNKYKMDDEFKDKMVKKYGHIHDEVWNKLKTMVKTSNENKFTLKTICNDAFFVSRPTENTNTLVRNIINIIDKDNVEDLDKRIFNTFFKIEKTDEGRRIVLIKEYYYNNDPIPSIAKILPDDMKKTFIHAYEGDLDKECPKTTEIIEAYRNDAKFTLTDNDIKKLFSSLNTTLTTNGYTLNKYIGKQVFPYSEELDEFLKNNPSNNNNIIINGWYRKNNNEFLKCSGNNESGNCNYVEISNLPSDPNFKNSFNSVCKIFNNKDECENFLKNIINQTGLQEIENLLKNENIIQSLKEHINDINPVIVVSILKQLGFRKKLIHDKFYNTTMNIETFDHWLERAQKESRYANLVSANNLNNLRELLSLFIDYINYNPTILNKPATNIFGQKQKQIQVQEQIITPNSELKNYYQNIPLYVPSKVTINSEKDWNKLRDETDKVWGSWYKPINFSSLNTLPREIAPTSLIPWFKSLVLGVNPTRVGHIPITSVYYGGNSENNNVDEIIDVEIKKYPRFVSSTVLSLFETLQTKLNNKTLDENTKNTIIDEINQLFKLEKGLYEKLETIQKYIKFVEMFGDNDKETSKLAIDKIKELIQKYEQDEKTISKNNNKLELIANKIFDRIVGNDVNGRDTYIDL